MFPISSRALLVRPARRPGTGQILRLFDPKRPAYKSVRPQGPGTGLRGSLLAAIVRPCRSERRWPAARRRATCQYQDRGSEAVSRDCRQCRDGGSPAARRCSRQCPTEALSVPRAAVAVGPRLLPGAIARSLVRDTVSQYHLSSTLRQRRASCGKPLDVT